MMLTSSDFIMIIVSVIYAIALFYTVITFKRTKELDQIRITETIFNDLRELDRELSKIPSGHEHNPAKKEGYFRMINTVDWLSFLVNKKVISDIRMIEYMKPTLIQYYEDSFVQNILAEERYSNSYHDFRKLYQRMKKV